VLAVCVGCGVRSGGGVDGSPGAGLGGGCFSAGPSACCVAAVGSCFLPAVIRPCGCASAGGVGGFFAGVLGCGVWPAFLFLAAAARFRLIAYFPPDRLSRQVA